MRIVFILILSALFLNSFGKPRFIKGTVYNEKGKKAAGVMVTADNSKDKYYTSFDGNYEIKASTRSKWLKFKFPGKEETLNIEGIRRDVIDFGHDPTWNNTPVEKNKLIKEK